MQLAFCLYKYFPFGGLQRDFLRIALLKGKFANFTLPRLLPDRMLDRMIGKRLGLLK